MTPEQSYQKAIELGKLISDPAQLAAMAQLERLYHQLIESELNRPQIVESSPNKSPHVLVLKARALGQKYLPRYFESASLNPNLVTPLQGIYMWGGVGRGKTFMMDLFFDALPFSAKMRLHFHRFMQRVHQLLSQYQQQEDPLLLVAEELKNQARVICFDEFFVSDITDAMLLGRLFEALFAKGVVLVATSNVPPKELYPNGLQRSRFLPAIDLLERHCQVVNIDNGIDYRLAALTKAKVYFCPHDQKTEGILCQLFEQLSAKNLPSSALDASETMLINDRSIKVIAKASGVLWTSFAMLCESARSSADFIEISKLYHSVILSDVKRMGQDNDNAARRFIALVDELYDQKVNLIISAEASLDALYHQGNLAFEFDRCRSRLVEMQSEQYLQAAHQQKQLLIS